MGPSSRVLQWVNLGLLVLLVYLVVEGVPALRRFQAARDRAKTPRPQYFDWVDKSKGMQLIMFYASPGVIERGESANICYGVAQAAKVALDPPVANMWPSLNRCFPVNPSRDTTYRLTLEDERGQRMEESLTIRVVAPGTIRPVEIVAPPLAITDFSVRAKLTEPDGSTLYSIGFHTTGAEVVSISPEAFPPGRVLMGQFYVKPERTTTYTLTARGQGRTLARTLILQAP